MCRKLLLLLMLAAAGITALGGATLALLTAQAAPARNVFQAGTLIIGAPGAGSNTGFMDFQNIAPGDSRSANLQVKNLGTLPFQYQATANFQSGDQALYDHLHLAIRRGATPLWTGWLSDVGGVLLNRHLAPDNPSTPATEGVDELSFTVTLDPDVINPDGSPYDDNLLQDKTVLISFVFNAVQTARGYSSQHIPHQWVSGGAPLSLRADEGVATYNLPWAFPLYDGSFNQVMVSTNGILTLDGSFGDWDNSEASLRNIRAIAPLWDDWTTTENSDDVLVYVEAATDRVTFTWRAQHYDTGVENRFQTTLYHDGRIQFNYDVAAGVSATMGVSMGDGVRYFTQAVNASDPTQSIVFNP